jgi:hypothetical protein
MRPSAAFDIELRKQGVWSGVVLGLLGLALATDLTWWWHLQLQSTPTVLAFVVALGLVAVLLSAASLLRLSSWHLRWDGLAWTLARAGADDAPRLAGRLEVALDVGGWMLMRFVPSHGNPWLRTVWLPAQRRGIEGRWHDLRCAVYSPRPDASPDIQHE